MVVVIQPAILSVRTQVLYVDWRVDSPEEDLQLLLVEHPTEGVLLIDYYESKREERAYLSHLGSMISDRPSKNAVLCFLICFVNL